MHHTTRTMLATLKDKGEDNLRRIYRINRDHVEVGLLDRAVVAWIDAGCPDADPEPEAARAPSLDALARAVARLETSPLAGGADLRAELEAARAELDLLAQRLGEREAELRIAREGHAELRDLADGLREQRNTARAEAAACRRIAADNAESAARWRKTACDLAARPRLRDRVLRWVEVARG